MAPNIFLLVRLYKCVAHQHTPYDTATTTQDRQAHRGVILGALGHPRGWNDAVATTRRRAKEGDPREPYNEIGLAHPDPNSNKIYIVYMVPDTMTVKSKIQFSLGMSRRGK